jgi:hypothetical protein
MTTRASGRFDVKLTPQATEAEGGGEAVGRLLIDKRYRGDLEGTGKGQMLGARTGTEGSAVYVAIELVTAKLNGRSGTFVLHHRSIMTRGAPNLAISVVPDSGTGDLVGLTGTMTIDITDGKHSYGFEYKIP